MSESISSNAPQLASAPRAARPRSWPVVRLGFLIAAGLPVVIFGLGTDVCSRRGLPSGSEGLGYAVMLLFTLVIAVTIAVAIVIVSLLLRGERRAAVTVLASVLGLVVGLWLATVVNQWRAEQTSDAACLAALEARIAAEPTPRHVPAEVSVQIEGLAAATFAGQGSCEQAEPGDARVTRVVAGRAFETASSGRWEQDSVWLHAIEVWPFGEPGVDPPRSAHIFVEDRSREFTSFEADDLTIGVVLELSSAWDGSQGEIKLLNVPTEAIEPRRGVTPSPGVLTATATWRCLE